MSTSIYRPVSLDAVAEEYALAAAEADDYRKAKWGSHEGMVNRFRLAHACVAWDEVNTWLDVGCAGGAFFRFAEDQGHAFESLLGVDIVDDSLELARRQKHVSPVRFVNVNLLGGGDLLATYDLVTAIGVLQQCGGPPRLFLPALLCRARIGGQLFLTTKNIGWNEFREGKLTPYEGHSWFAYDDLARIIEQCGGRIVAHGGFLPRENRRVPLEESHTMYILARRQA